MKRSILGQTFAAYEFSKGKPERAAAVVLALTGTHGIAAARLKPFGNGPYAPVASNDAEPGRARNRRVELVKQ